jgi:hypothetical protein
MISLGLKLLLIAMIYNDKAAQAAEAEKAHQCIYTIGIALGSIFLAVLLLGAISRSGD